MTRINSKRERFQTIVYLLPHYDKTPDLAVCLKLTQMTLFLQETSYHPKKDLLGALDESDAKKQLWKDLLRSSADRFLSNVAPARS